MIQVKGNQKNLFKAAQQISANESVVDSTESFDKKRGRDEKRKVKIFSANTTIPIGWESLNTIILVERSSIRKGKRVYETSYYISSLLSKDASYFAKAVRGHWSIENRLHWVKDVILNEDNSGIKKDNGIENLSIFKNIAINIARGLGYDSIKESQTYFASNVSELIQILRT